jgi:DNA-binding response OmpR family regulator
MPLNKRSMTDSPGAAVPLGPNHVSAGQARPAVVKLPILLFDPNPVAASLLAMQLRRSGFEIQLAADGASAVLAARGRLFSFILVVADLADAQMRKCLHELRDAEPEAWLIVISDPAIEGALAVVYELGCNAMINVPFNVSDLAQRLSVSPARSETLAHNGR